MNAQASGGVALHPAAKYGYADYVRILLEAGAAKSVNVSDSEGFTPLMLALKYCDDAKKTCSCGENVNRSRRLP